MVAERYRGYKPCLWSYRIIDKEKGVFEIVQNSRTPKTHHLVTLSADGAMSCTCPSGRRGFAGTQRGCCQHVYALITFALQYRGVGTTYTYAYAYASGSGIAL